MPLVARGSRTVLVHPVADGIHHVLVDFQELVDDIAVHQVDLDRFPRLAAVIGLQGVARIAADPTHLVVEEADAVGVEAVGERSLCPRATAVVGLDPLVCVGPARADPVAE